jgi:Uma2 family endonuclease
MSMNAQRSALAANTLAPWAEIVPGVGPVTVDALLTLSDDQWRYEVVEGVLVRVAGSGDRASTIAVALASMLFAVAHPRCMGRITGADGVYKLPGAETGLLPDVGFYGAALFPLVVDRNKPIPFAPELAVEVASPDQSVDDMAAKARRYLRGGTRLVWIVWPEGQTVDVWRPGDLAPSLTLHTGDALDGEALIPGFRQPLTDIFAV